MLQGIMSIFRRLSRTFRILNIQVKGGKEGDIEEKDLKCIWKSGSKVVQIKMISIQNFDSSLSLPLTVIDRLD